MENILIPILFAFLFYLTCLWAIKYAKDLKRVKKVKVDLTKEYPKRNRISIIGYLISLGIIFYLILNGVEASEGIYIWTLLGSIVFILAKMKAMNIERNYKLATWIALRGEDAIYSFLLFVGFLISVTGALFWILS